MESFSSYAHKKSILILTPSVFAEIVCTIKAELKDENGEKLI